jgi:hypothetical protein
MNVSTCIGIYTQSAAAIFSARAGRKWRPANGTEGELFFAGWCCRCARDRAMREGEPVEECDDDQVCPIIRLTFLHQVDAQEYPSEWQYGQDGQSICTAFIPDGDLVPPPRCAHTVDMFEA